MIKIDNSQILSAIKDIGRLNERYALVQRHTISDMKSRVPGKVSKAVSAVYAIPKSYVVAMRHPNTKGRVRMRVAGIPYYKIIHFPWQQKRVRLDSESEQIEEGENTNETQNYI